MRWKIIPGFRRSVAAQSAALDALHNKVVRQKFVLRITGELGHLPIQGRVLGGTGRDQQ